MYNIFTNQYSRRDSFLGPYFKCNQICDVNFFVQKVRFSKSLIPSIEACLWIWSKMDDQVF